MGHVAVDGARLAYEVDGDSSAPALLLIHAGVATMRMWDPLIDALAAQHFVVRFDTRGFGATECNEDEFSNRSDAIAVLDAVGVTRATVLGASRGGLIGIDLALAHPDRVAGLVVIGSGPSGFPEIELTDREDRLLDELDVLFEERKWDDLARAEARFWAIGPHRHEDEVNADFLARAVELNAPNAAHFGTNPVPTPLEPPAYDRTSDIAVPTLVTVGEFDTTPALAQFEYLATTIPGADAARFPASAHLPSVEHPQEFARVLTEWLDAHQL